jgi:ESS family glutamate:Na+ symporter
MTIVLSFSGLCLLLMAGHFLRTQIRLLRRLYLPSSIIAGLLGLIIIQTCQRAGAPLNPAWTAGWGSLPGFLINIVFACLFLGVAVPGPRELWRRAGPQLAYGQVVAWGQYVVGVGLFIILLGPVFKVNRMFGGIVPVGFEGGHGTAAGMAKVFSQRGWEAGRDLGLASATAGILSAVIVGMALVNWAARRGYAAKQQRPEDIPEDESIGIIPPDRRPEAGRLTVRPAAIGALSLHLAVIGLAIFIGFVMQQLLVKAGEVSGNKTFTDISGAFPLFPLCMIGGMLVQLGENWLDVHNVIDPGLTRRIQNCALDFLVVAAIATIRIEVVAAAIVPFLIVVAAAILWNVFCVTSLARRMLPDAWFERAIAEMGQSMGVTATGLLLLRVVDPEYETPAADAFASKQLLHEPFMGGGLWTATAIPLLATVGATPVFLIACGAVLFWLVVVFGLRAARRGKGQPPDDIALAPPKRPDLPS